MTDRPRGRPPRVTADDWVAAALDALADGGLAAVAVEPLAHRLGTSKGSFYGYFDGRAALVRAALQRWERAETEDVAVLLAAIADPAERLSTLAIDALRGVRGAAVALALLVDADDPLVGPFVRRVTARRLDVVADCLTALGHPPEQVRHLAQLSYSAYLGAAALRRGVPELAPDPDGGFVAVLLRAVGVPVRPGPAPPVPAARGRRLGR